MTEVKGLLTHAIYPENAKSIFAPMCRTFKMQPELHNMQRYTRWAQASYSANWGIPKFFYLRLRLVVCFYPRPPAWPWSWGCTYCQLACMEWVMLLLQRHFEVSPDTSISNVADSGIRASRISSFEGALFSRGQELIIRFGMSKQYQLLRSLFGVSWRTIGSEALEEVICVLVNNN